MVFYKIKLKFVNFVSFSSSVKCIKSLKTHPVAAEVADDAGEGGVPAEGHRQVQDGLCKLWLEGDTCGHAHALCN